MKKIYKVLFVIVISFIFITPSYEVKAVTVPTPSTPPAAVDILPQRTHTAAEELEQMVKQMEEARNTEHNEDETIVEDCSYIFGDPSNESSTAYMIQKFLNYAKVLAPLLVILLSGFDFTKTALTGDADQMKKAGKKLGIRLGCAVGVFLAPMLAGFLIDFINRKSAERTCKIR